MGCRRDLETGAQPLAEVKVNLAPPAVAAALVVNPGRIDGAVSAEERGRRKDCSVENNDSKEVILLKRRPCK